MKSDWGAKRPGPMGGWRKPSIVEPDVLRLHEVIVLRRLRNGDTQAEAARALGWSTNKVNCLVSYVRRRFGADSPQELLDLPRVIEQLEEDGGS